jgi:hypothetical protein
MGKFADDAKAARKGTFASDAKAAAGAPAAPAQDEVSGFDRALADPIGTGMAAMTGLAKGIPGGEMVQAKLASLFTPGMTEQDAAKQQQEISAEHPTASTVGAVGGAVAGAAVLGPADAVGAATQAGVLAPAYKLGETANQAQLHNDPIHIEQISHAFSPDDVFEAAGLTALLGAPGLALRGLSGVGRGARAAAVSTAGSSLSKAAAKLGMTEAELATRALDEHLLAKAGNITRKIKEAGANMSKAVQSANIDDIFRQDAASAMEDIVKQNAANTALKPAAAKITRQAKELMSTNVDGEQFHSIIKSMKDEAGAAFKSKRAQAGQFFSDVAKSLEDKLGQHLDIIDPKAGELFRGSRNEYKIYTQMAPEVRSAATKQLTVGQIAGKAAGLATAHVAGQALGGPGGAVIGDLSYAAFSARTLRNKSPALLLDRVSKRMPSQSFAEQTDDLLRELFGTSTNAARMTAEPDAPKKEKKRGSY